MTVVSIDAAAELLDDTPRHVVALGDAGELELVDTAVHQTPPGKTVGADGKTYPRTKRRLKVTAESIRAFIARRTLRQEPVRRRRRKPEHVIEFF